MGKKSYLFEQLIKQYLLISKNFKDNCLTVAVDWMLLGDVLLRKKNYV